MQSFPFVSDCCQTGEGYFLVIAEREYFEDKLGLNNNKGPMLIKVQLLTTRPGHCLTSLVQLLGPQGSMGLNSQAGAKKGTDVRDFLQLFINDWQCFNQ